MNIGRFGSQTGKGIYGIARVVAWVSGTFAVILMFLTAADVFARYVVASPIKGTIDITVLMIVIIAFFAAGYSQVTDTHVAVRVITARLSRSVNAILNAITRFLGMGIFGLMAWALGSRAWGYMVGPPVKAPHSELLCIPYIPFFFVAAAGTLILCLVLVVDFFRSLAEVLGKRADG